MTVMLNMRLGVCGACENSRAKYTCPKCKFASCSLKCVQKHKQQSGCDGIRNKTNYIPKDRIAELDVLSDYRLLESTSRCIDGYSRDEIKKSTRKFRDPHAVPLPPHLLKFRNACFRRGKCRLHFLPQKFQRHQDNTSRFIWKKNEINWRIQLLFPHAFSPSYQKVVLDNISENTMVYDLLQPYVIGKIDNGKNDSDQKPSKDPGSYDIYKAAGFSGVKVLLKSEGDFNKSKRYHELDISKCLKDNLSGKSIAEHPILMIILNHHSDSFNLCEDTDDEEMDTESIDMHRKDEHQNAKGHISSNIQNEVDKAQSAPDIMSNFTNQDHTKESVNSFSNTNPTTRREAEFNKACYDFYLNYYSEKYGIGTPQPTNLTAVPTKPVENIIPQVHRACTSNTSISSPGRTDQMNQSLPHSQVSQQFSGELKKYQAHSVKSSESSTNETNSENISKEAVSNKASSSLSLLAVYSDSEEEMDA